MRAVLAALILCAAISAALAHDPTGYWAKQIAEGKAPPAAWWNGLASGKGHCCSDADGLRVETDDWDTKDGHYRVYFHGLVIRGTAIPDGWVFVPDDAVLKEPNRYGPAVVWPYIIFNNDVGIRCFLPGAGA